jgi:hypothetical protein
VLLHTGQAAVPMGEGFWALPVDTLWRMTSSDESGEHVAPVAPRLSGARQAPVTLPAARGPSRRPGT